MKTNKKKQIFPVKLKKKPRGLSHRCNLIRRGKKISGGGEWTKCTIYTPALIFKFIQTEMDFKAFFHGLNIGAHFIDGTINVTRHFQSYSERHSKR